MRLVRASFDNALGLKGSVSFGENRPIMLYGENVSGKSNVINLLRYCLIPKPKKRKRKIYSEETRLKRDEILLEHGATGSVVIYFRQRGKLYQLRYDFSRKKSRVAQTLKMYEAQVGRTPFGNEAHTREEFLKGLEWNDSGIRNLTQLDKKLKEIGIYSEILDTLISPSNIRNFSEAISGSLVTVPDIIAKRISTIHKNADKYRNNLRKLQGVLTIEKDGIEKKLRELKDGFQTKSKNLSEINADEIFVPGGTIKNLEMLLTWLKKSLESIPEKTTEIRETLKELSSKKYELWISALSEAGGVLRSRETLNQYLEMRKTFEEREKVLNEWKIIFERLPPISNFQGLIDFEMPNHENFDFSVFSNPERIESIFLRIGEARESIKKANKICQKYKVFPKPAEINGLIKSYEKLRKVIMKPSKSVGDDAIIFEKNKQTIVSIPLDVALKKPHYLRGVQSTPTVHRPGKWDVKRFEKEVSLCQNMVKSVIAELRQAKKDLSKTKTNLVKAKRSLDGLDEEITLLEDKKKSNEKGLDTLTKKWTVVYDHLCKVFGLKYDEIDISTKEKVNEAHEILSKKREKSQEIFTNDIRKQLKKHPEIISQHPEIALKKITPDIVKDIMKELKSKEEKLNKLREGYRDIQGWISLNINEIKSLENRGKTVGIIETCLVIANKMLSKIYDRTDVDKMIEDLAQNIEDNVRDAYIKIFPEEPFSFEHLEKGRFMSKINSEPITHPSGSQKE